MISDIGCYLYHEKFGASQKGNDRLPSIHFQVRTVSSREGNKTLNPLYPMIWAIRGPAVRISKMNLKSLCPLALEGIDVYHITVYSFHSNIPFIIYELKHANSLIPARLGVRWYNTTRYTLKYWSQCNSCDGGCSAGGITLFSVAIHECWAKLWSLHRVRASLTTAVLSQMQSPYMKRLCTACYRWYTLRTPHICDFAQSVENRCRFWRCNGLKQWVN